MTHSGTPGEVRGKRFLITHTLVQNIMGSTVVSFELADFLKSEGAEVAVFANQVGDPAQKWFEDAGIPLVGDRDCDLRLGDFDVVWVHSQVLPLTFVRQLGEPLAGPPPLFIFNHMSAIDYAIDEHPYIYGLEERLSSLSVFVSEKSREHMAGYYSRAPRSALYPNPAPRAFCELERTHAPSPRRVLMVTNHRAPEVMAAKESLRHLGLEVLHLGSGADAYQLLKPEALGSVDVVITIGKTVQYCLTSGTPVFVYDHFGGYGYLTSDNLEQAQAYHFSGRSGSKWSSDEIVGRLLDGYPDAVRFHVDHRGDFVRRYSIEHVLPSVLRSAQARPLEPFPEDYVNATLSAQMFASRFYQEWGMLINLHDQVAALSRREAEQAQESKQLSADLESVLGSRSFRLGHAALQPVRLLRNRTRRAGRSTSRTDTR